MLVLLSPSKAQDFKSDAPTRAHTQPVFLKESELLIEELRKRTVKDLRKLMGVSEAIVSLNRKRFKEFKTPFTLSNAKQAAYAFTGDVYDGFNPESFDEDTRNFAQLHIRILSGLYGLLKPLDLIQPYRLEMKTKLKNPRGKDLYDFWGNRITEELKKELETSDTKTLINLASEEYAAAVDFTALGDRVIMPQFKEKKGSSYKTVGLVAKKARGAMARAIAQQRILNPEALQFFAEDGYRLNVSLSKPNLPVYTRG